MGVKTVFCIESVIYIYKSIHILDMYVFNFRPHLMQVVLVLQGKH